MILTSIATVISVVMAALSITAAAFAYDQKEKQKDLLNKTKANIVEQERIVENFDLEVMQHKSNIRAYVDELNFHARMNAKLMNEGTVEMPEVIPAQEGPQGNVVKKNKNGKDYNDYLADSGMHGEEIELDLLGSDE